MLPRNTKLPIGLIKYQMARKHRMHGMGWDGMRWDGMGWDGMGWDGMGWDGMVSQVRDILSVSGILKTGT
jgi:hypothetical protein